MEPILNSLLNYLEPHTNCVLLYTRMGLYLFTEEEFYPHVLVNLYRSYMGPISPHTQGPDLPNFHKYNVFTNHDYCASQLAMFDRQVNIRQIFHETLLETIFQHLVKNETDLYHVKSLADYVGTLAPFTGPCYHIWLHNHYVRASQITSLDFPHMT